VHNLELIEAYFNEELSAEKKSEFEQRIAEDAAFAEETAFYLSSRQAAAAELGENRGRFREIYQQYKQQNIGKVAKVTPLRKLWPWVAAAAVLAGIIFGWYAWLQPVSLPAMADSYIRKNFQNLSVTMSATEDSVQTGLRLYNEGKGEEALRYFESIVLRDSSLSDVKKYAGIACLQLGQYDKAINYFTQLENEKLFANPGKFYHALTLLKRNQPGDLDTAKQLLQQVVNQDLAEKEEAEKWLKKAVK
jgi:tetratricopeptide (TPR) repeat protein